jgi:hypothetical protein
MENSPLSPEDNSEDHSTAHTRNVEALGAMVIEPNQNHERLQPGTHTGEEIGRWLLSNEINPTSERNRAAAIDKRVETINTNDLLAVSDKIMIEGTSLRKIYETHLIGERALRRLVGEYLRTGDIRNSLKFELLQHEVDYERDPQLRDKIKREMKTGGSVPLDTLLHEAGVMETDQSATHSLKERLLEADNHHPLEGLLGNRKFLDRVFISVILTLLLLIIILFIIRR